MNVRVNESMTAPSHVGEKRELWVHIVPTGKIFSRLWLFDNKNIYSQWGLSDLNGTHTLPFKELQWIMSDWRMHWLMGNETMSATTRMFLFHVAFDNFVVSSDATQTGESWVFFRVDWFLTGRQPKDIASTHASGWTLISHCVCRSEMDRCSCVVEGESSSQHPDSGLYLRKLGCVR